MSKISFVIKRNGAKVKFNKDRIVNAIYRAAVELGERDRKIAEHLANQVVEKLGEINKKDHVPHIEEIQDIVEKILIKNGHAKLAKTYILYREANRQKRRKESKQDSRPSENIPWAKCWEILDWAVTNNLHTIKALNKRIKKGELPNIIEESEAAYERDIHTAAELIADRSKELKMVIITGPSSSGKTTTTYKLETILKNKGFHFVSLNIDHYFFNLELHPKDEFGDYDFETPQALDLSLINEHLKNLVDGKKVMIPFYDFKTGMRTLNHTPKKLKKNEVLLLDSLHGLFPAMTKDIPHSKKFKLYLEPLLQMKGPYGRYVRWTDLRMIRRMLRDAAFRAYNPQQTLEHWHYVRNSELRNIIPYIKTTDYIINSGMPYEIALYRPKLLELFSVWTKKYRNDSLKRDAYTRASRVYEFLQAVEPVEDDSLVPGDSVLREFIGGSSLKY